MTVKNLLFRASLLSSDYDKTCLQITRNNWCMEIPGGRNNLRLHEYIHLPCVRKTDCQDMRETGNQWDEVFTVSFDGQTHDKRIRCARESAFSDSLTLSLSVGCYIAKLYLA